MLSLFLLRQPGERPLLGLARTRKSAGLWLAPALLGTAGCHLLSPSPRQSPQGGIQTGVREMVSIDQSFSFSAGDVLAGQPLRHVFQYRNDTATPLERRAEQSIQTTCGCTRVQLSRHRLAPGESADLSIEIDTDNRLGDVAESATVTWYTDGGEPRHCQFTLRGRVMSAFAFDPPELTFSKEDLRSGAHKLVRCRSDLPIDWQHVQLEADESYVVVDSLQVDKQAGELVFSVGCRPTHQGDHRRTAVRVAGSSSNALETGQKPYVAVLPIFSHDVAALKIAPHVPVFEPAPQGPGWSGYLILTGDLIEQGIRPKTISAPGCRVTFETLELGRAAQRVNVTLEGPLDTAPRERQKLQLTFDNGLRQSLAFRLKPH